MISKKCCLYKKLTLLAATVFISLGSSAIAQAKEPKLHLSVEEIKALIPEVEAVERSISNIKIDSEAWIERKASSDPCEPWERTPIYVASTAWFDGRPKGKARVDVHKQVAKWIDGPAPYGEESYSVSFDGQYGRVVDRTFSHSGKTHVSKRGELLHNAPKRLWSIWCNAYTGAQFSLHFFFNDEDEARTFSQFFKATTSAAVVEANAIEVIFEEFEGVECIKLGSGETKYGHKIWWLDPSRGFALLGHEHTNILKDGSQWLILRIKVSRLKEVAPGIWWPVEAYAESEPGPHHSDEPYTRMVYRASNVVANNPNFDESIFTVPFPDGYLIDDQVAGRKYKVGEDPNAQKNQSKK
jgi:hypothetical protein